MNGEMPPVLEDAATTGAQAADAARALIDQAWWHIYLDLKRAGELGRQALDQTEHLPGLALRGYAHFHRAFALLRLRQVDEALKANEQARSIFERDADRRGLLLCLEVDALHLRAQGKADEAWQLHHRIEVESAGVEREPIDDYISCNSRGITRKLLGQTDETLRDFYRALEAAQAVVSPGARINALVNLGGYHGDLYNLADARELSREAMRHAEAAQAWVAFMVAGLNLVSACDGLNLHEEAFAAGQALLRHEDVRPLLAGAAVAPIAVSLLNGGQIDEAERWLSTGVRSLIGDGDGKTDFVWAHARCRLARGDMPGARLLAEERLAHCQAHQVDDQPYPMMKLLDVASRACEALGDSAAALAHLQQSYGLYQRLVGTSARARFVAMQTQHDIVEAKRERDHARRAQQSAERDRQRLAELNVALKQKIAEADALQAQLREQALRDPLTGLHNRRYLYEVGPGHLALARRGETRCSVALLDVDHFKRLNDTHGHETGDGVLQCFARLLVSRLRRSDVVCRFGGEEFVVLVPGASALEAHQLLQTLIDELAALSIPTSAGVPVTGVTFSAGIAEHRADVDSLDSLLRLADERLYRAKQQGRARACSE